MNDKSDDDNVVPFGIHEGKPKTGARKRKTSHEMPLTLKQERLAELLAAGTPFLQAYQQTYNCKNLDSMSTYKKSWAVSHHPKIVARVKDLKEKIKLAEQAHLSGAAPINLPKVITDAFTKEQKIVHDVIINRQALTHMALQDREGAREHGQFSAAVASLKFLGTLHQLTTDNREANKVSELEQMTPQQLREFIQDEIQRCGLVLEMDDGLLELIDMRPLTTTKQ